MAKNHYVSQLIIRRFSDKTNKINVFDVNKRSILENKNSADIFYKNNIYSEETEDKLNKLLEDPFAKLIDEKIIDKDKIIISRKDVLLIKKYLLVDSIRTLTARGFKKVFTGFADVADRYWFINKQLKDNSLPNLPKMSDLKENTIDSFERALRVFIEADNLQGVVDHKDATRELYLWCKVFLDGYLAFWDASQEQDFILTDNGLTTEYEPSHQLYEGLSHSKISYLLHMLKQDPDKGEVITYSTLLERLTAMYENFSIFNLTSSRSIVIVNPFFKLYGNQEFIFYNDIIVNPRIPDIWPSYIKDKMAFKQPLTEYKVKGSYSLDDEFIYQPRRLTLDDTIYVNYLFLSQTIKLLGFRTFEKIKDSLYAFQAMRMLNHKDIYTDNSLNNLSNLVNHLMNDEFNYVWDFYKESEDIRPRTNPFDFTERIAQMCMDDTRNNIYALEYLLSSEEKVRTMKNFDFMGSPDERIDSIKKDINRLKKK
jgi:hypothetical protein